MLDRAENIRTEEPGDEIAFRWNLKILLVLCFVLFSAGTLAALNLITHLNGPEKLTAWVGTGLVMVVASFFLAKRIAVVASHSVERMSALLTQTRKQAVQLEIQQKKLQDSNKVLEEQAKALTISEERLRAKRTELKKINEQLERAAIEKEAQTSVLELQKIEIEKKNEELRAAQKSLEKRAEDLGKANEYKSQFLANMSHDLRTPLNSILILSRILADNVEGNLNEKQVEYAGTILSSGTDVLSLINDVLDLSKVEIGRMDVHLQQVFLDDLVTNLERTFQPVAEKNRIFLESSLADGLPSYIRTDQQRLEQILKNLLSNSFKFTFQGGVSLRIGRPGKHVDLSKSGLIQDETIAFSVSDTGIGISEDKQKIVFDAFQQADGSTSRKYGGTGLGLSISRELAKLLGGEIQLESESGSGSTFTLYLPEDYETLACTPGPVQSMEAGADFELKRSSEKVLENQPPQSATASSCSEKTGVDPPSVTQFVHDDRTCISPDDMSILIIEDDRVFAQIFRDHAREKGFKILVAESGEIGLHFVNLYHPSAIILDVVLPGIDGWSVMTRLKENLETRHIPIYIMSGFDKNLDAMKLGAIGFLEKPANAQRVGQVLEKIKQVISKSVKDLLIVAEDMREKKDIVAIVDNPSVSTTTVSSTVEALNQLQFKSFDCIILDMALSDRPSLELLEAIKRDEPLRAIPVIIYTDKGTANEKDKILKKYADKIIIKGAHSSEKLFDETTLFLHLPEADLPDGKRKILQQVHDKKKILKDKQILMVDDDMRDVFAVSAILEKVVGQVHVGKNGIEALKKLEKHPDMDLVLMDIMMPKMDGYEALSKIRSQARFKHLPIIALTAKAMKGDRAKCLEAGADDYLVKPVDLEKLLAMLRSWLYY